VGQRHRTAPRFAFDQGKVEVRQVGAAHLFGEIAGVKSQFNGPGPDRSRKVRVHRGGTFNQRLVGVNLMLDKALLGLHPRYFWFHYGTMAGGRMRRDCCRDVFRSVFRCGALRRGGGLAVRMNLPRRKLPPSLIAVFPPA